MSSAEVSVGSAAAPRQAVNAPQDDVSNHGNFKVIDSTLREGELYRNASFDTETKIKIAKEISDFGVEYIEVTSPLASEQSRADCETIAKLGLKSKVLTHVPCTLEHAKLAVSTGVQGVGLVYDNSQSRGSSQGEPVEVLDQQAVEVIQYVKSQGLETRFTLEEAFRTDLVDLLALARAVDEIGVDRLTIAGSATPRQVYDLIRSLRGAVKCGIECHFDNDNGCAIANSHSALEAGATHIDCSVLGIGPAQGITALGGFLGRMVVSAPDYVKSRYELKNLKPLENNVAEQVNLKTPFNNPITGWCAFTHKAGIHAKAILKSPGTYEVLNPEDWGVDRTVVFASRLTGWNAIKSRVEQLGLAMTDDQVKELTAKIKQTADTRPLGVSDTDEIIREFHQNLQKE